MLNFCRFHNSPYPGIKNRYGCTWYICKPPYQDEFIIYIYHTLSAISCFVACFVLAFPLPADAILMNWSMRTGDKQKTNIFSGLHFVVNKNIYWRASKGGKPDLDEKPEPDGFKTFFFAFVYTQKLSEKDFANEITKLVWKGMLNLCLRNLILKHQTSIHSLFSNNC